MNRKKTVIFVFILIIMLVIALSIVFLNSLKGQKHLHYFKEIDKAKSAAEEILDYAWAAMKTIDYSCEERSRYVLEAISGAYNKIGNNDKAIQVKDIANKLRCALDSFEPYKTEYEEEWDPVFAVGDKKGIKDLVVRGRLQEAIEASRDNPYALAQIAIFCSKDCPEINASELMGKAYKKAVALKNDSNWRWRNLWLDIVSAYLEIGETDKAFQMLKEIRWNSNLNEIVGLLAKMGKFEEAFRLINKISSVGGRVYCLIDIAVEYHKTNRSLDNRTRNILRQIAIP